MTPAYTGSVDYALAVDDDGLFLTGWLAVNAAGAEIRLAGADKRDGRLALDYRFRRPDIEEAGHPGRPHGFACLVDAPGAALRASSLRLEILTDDGVKTALGIPDPVLDPVAARDHVLWVLELGEASDEVLASHVYPALERLRRQIQPSVGIAGVHERGRVPAGAEASIIILLDGSLDALTPKIALLSTDADIRNAEIVLVLDSPELESALTQLTHHLHQLYGLPMRVVTLTGDGGGAYANNVGAARSSGEFLVLLRSDVFPDRPGWLRTLTATLRQDETVVAAGPKLLFEDRSIQHAGTYFERDAAGRWGSVHYHAGMPSSLPAVNEARRVPALTAACLAIARSDFDAAGGFDTTFALGDYEDADLCLRLQESGRRCHYVPQAELFNFATRPRSRAETAREVYNRWLFNHRWGAVVSELMDGFRGGRAAAQAIAATDT